MTTDELEEENKLLLDEVEFLCDVRRWLSREIVLLRINAKRIRGIIFERKKSPYNGEYFLKGEFRKKYGKRYSEMTSEERQAYSRDYWEKNKERLKIVKRIEYLKKKEAKDGKKIWREEIRQLLGKM